MLPILLEYGDFEASIAMFVAAEEASRRCGRMYFVCEALSALLQEHARAAGLTQGMCLQPSLLTQDYCVSQDNMPSIVIVPVVSCLASVSIGQRSCIRAGGRCETGEQIGETCLCCARSIRNRLPRVDDAAFY